MLLFPRKTILLKNLTAYMTRPMFDIMFVLFQCKNHTEHPELFQNSVSEYQLMDMNVGSLFNGPIFYKPGVQFLKVVAGPSKSGGGDSRNIYIATSEFCSDNS